MKPTRKLNRGSFVGQVSGTANKPMGAGKGAVETDHDLVQPKSGGKPTDPDN